VQDEIINDFPTVLNFQFYQNASSIEIDKDHDRQCRICMQSHIFYKYSHFSFCRSISRVSYAQLKTSDGNHGNFIVSPECKLMTLNLISNESLTSLLEFTQDNNFSYVIFYSKNVDSRVTDVRVTFVATKRQTAE
jgi:hypothetical protein